MKKILVVFFVLSVLVVAYERNKNKVEIPKEILNYDISPAETMYLTNPYAIKYIDDVSKLTLNSNLIDKKPAYEISQGCDFVVNGGFYTKENKHIGLLVSDYNELSPFQRNDTFNGFLYFDNKDNPVISDYPPESFRVVLQSGPVIKKDGAYRILDLASDKEARRVLAVTTTEKDLAFVVVYKSDSKLVGPKLSELPTILQEIERYEGVNFDSAINLDGGSASAFYDGDVKFSESSTIGSYFCLIK